MPTNSWIARVPHHVFTPLKDREKALKAKDVPRVRQGPTTDAALDQFLDLRQQGCGRCQLVAHPESMAGRQTSQDLTQQPHRRRRDALCLLPAGLRIAHLRPEQDQLPLLQLGRSQPGQVGIEMLACSAKRLPKRGGFLTQSVAVFALGRHFLQHLLIKTIA